MSNGSSDTGPRITTRTGITSSAPVQPSSPCGSETSAIKSLVQGRAGAILEWSFSRRCVTVATNDSISLEERSNHGALTSWE